jgi:CBS domain-containing protein
MPKRPVTEIMTSPVVTLQAEELVEEALVALRSNGISGAPVVDSNGVLVGLLDDSDLIVSEARVHGPTAIEILGAYITVPGEQRRFEQELRHVLAQTVEELMNDDPPSVGPNATVEDVSTIMVDRRISRVPVVDAERRVIGIVTRGDIVEAMRR